MDTNEKDVVIYRLIVLPTVSLHIKLITIKIVVSWIKLRHANTNIAIPHTLMDTNRHTFLPNFFIMNGDARETIMKGKECDDKITPTIV